MTSGLRQGIVEDKVIWATDCRYLNDARETLYTWGAFIERLKQLGQTHVN